MFRVVRKSNFDIDWYDEEFLNVPPMDQVACEAIVAVLNDRLVHGSSEHIYAVVPEDYKLYIGRVP